MHIILLCKLARLVVACYTQSESQRSADNKIEIELKFKIVWYTRIMCVLLCADINGRVTVATIVWRMLMEWQFVWYVNRFLVCVYDLHLFFRFVFIALPSIVKKIKNG